MVRAMKVKYIFSNLPEMFQIGKGFKKFVDQMYAIGVPPDLLKYHHLDITSIIKSSPCLC